MKIFLFGGAEIGEVAKQLKMLEKIIKQVKPKQILHIPFARTDTLEEEWQGDWFGRNIKLGKGMKYLNATSKLDISLARQPLVFISGGSNNINLLKKIKASPDLCRLIKTADCLIGESAGAKILGEYFRSKGENNTSKMLKGLGIIKNTVIEPHYIQRHRQKLLDKDMAETGAKYGIGIDSLVVLEFNPGQFPDKIKKIGRGRADIKIKAT